MKIVKKLTAEVPDTNIHYFRLDEWSNDDKETILMYGYDTQQAPELFKEHRKYKRKIYLNITSPTEFSSIKDHHNVSPLYSSAWFDEVYNICPYSVKWLNELNLTNTKYKTIFYPFNHQDIPEETEKIYDVCYHGGIHGDYHIKCLEIMKNNFNYRYMTMTHHINQLTMQNLHYATDLDMTNKDKINLIAQCKISICFNNYPPSPQNIQAIKSHKDWWKNEAFSEVDKTNIIPQFKNRFQEAAFSKTLNLVQRDKWNVVEEWYTPNEHFIYFDSVEDLQDKVQDILNNWDEYKPIVDRCYDKTLDYTVSRLYNIIKNDH